MISYIGGKSRISSFIIPYIPLDIETYIEPFGGAFWVFFKMDLNKYKNLKNVIYNDFNPLNVNLINCVKNYDEFYKIISKIPSQKKDLFDQFQLEIFHPQFRIDLTKPDYEAAYKYLYILSQNWSGTNPSKSKFIDLKGKYKSKFDSFKSKLTSPKWQRYFDKISAVENLDFGDVITKYDGKKSYFYCDPPYYRTENYYANHDFGIETHERLAKTLKGIDGKFSLSYYDFPQLSEWFPRDKYTWEAKEFSKAAMAKSGKAQTKGVELLIMNYDISNRKPKVALVEQEDEDFKI